MRVKLTSDVLKDAFAFGILLSHCGWGRGTIKPYLTRERQFMEVGSVWVRGSMNLMGHALIDDNNHIHIM